MQPWVIFLGIDGSKPPNNLLPPQSKYYLKSSPIPKSSRQLYWQYPERLAKFDESKTSSANLCCWVLTSLVSSDKVVAVTYFI